MQVCDIIGPPAVKFEMDTPTGMKLSLGTVTGCKLYKDERCVWLTFYGLEKNEVLLRLSHEQAAELLEAIKDAPRGDWLECQQECHEADVFGYSH